jgi:UDP-N-acetylmuramate--alanine ligase
MEYKGQIEVQNSKSKSKIDIYDDYGHHPTEIKATLEGAKKHFGKKNILCAFQPHHGKRLSLLFPDFVKAFDAADALFLFPVYSVAGRDKNTTTMTARTLAEHIMKRKKVGEVVYLERFEDLRAWIGEITRNGKLPYRDSVLVMMGAGDIYKETKKLLAASRRKK